VAAQTEGLVVDPQYLDFGEVWEDPKFVWTLPIENRSAADITIPEFSASCTCLGIDPQSLTVPAGQTAKVRLTLDLTTERPKRWDGSPRKFEVRVYPELENGLRHPGWKVHGRVRSAVTYEPRVLDFGESLVMGQSFDSRAVEVTAHMPLDSLVGSWDQALAAVQVIRLPEDPHKFSLQVQPRANLSVGPLKFAITLQPISQDGTRFPGVQVPVEGRVMDDVQVTPSKVLFGARPLGQKVEDTVVVHSLSGRPFEIRRVETASDDVTVNLLDDSLRASYQFRVTQVVSKPGNETSEVRFTIHTKEKSAATVTLRVSYLVVAYLS
jgi:hypothetical protein